MTNHRPHGGRRSVRFQDFDYGQPGAYFVTVCAYRRRSAFGRIVQGRMMLNEVGEIAEICWMEIPHHFPRIELDEHIIMPNHIHGILGVTDTPNPGNRDVPSDSNRSVERRGVACYARPAPRSPGPASGSLGAVVRSFKSAATRQLRADRPKTSMPLWQRNYYEHVIRDEPSLNRIREYISTNPLRWELDRENPGRTSIDEFDRWLESFKERPPQR